MVPEAPLERNDKGALIPQGEGWYVLNARDALPKLRALTDKNTAGISTARAKRFEIISKFICARSASFCCGHSSAHGKINNQGGAGLSSRME